VTEPRFNRAARQRLTRHTARLFVGETLFDRLARTVCNAECLPRKELFEAWETAKRIRRRFRGRPVVELCAGHGLLAHALLLLDDSIPDAICVDAVRPPSAAKIHAALVERWPRLEGRLRYVEADLGSVPIPPAALVVSVHACGVLTDRVLDRAIAAQAHVAVLPCCHALDKCDDGGLRGWLSGPLAVDVTRAERLRSHGYRLRAQTIPADITPHNRLLLGRWVPSR